MYSKLPCTIRSMYVAKRMHVCVVYLVSAVRLVPSVMPNLLLA